MNTEEIRRDLEAKEEAAGIRPKKPRKPTPVTEATPSAAPAPPVPPPAPVRLPPVGIGDLTGFSHLNVEIDGVYTSEVTRPDGAIQPVAFRGVLLGIVPAYNTAVVRLTMATLALGADANPKQLEAGKHLLVPLANFYAIEKYLPSKDAVFEIVFAPVGSIFAKKVDPTSLGILRLAEASLNLLPNGMCTPMNLDVFAPIVDLPKRVVR